MMKLSHLKGWVSKIALSLSTVHAVKSMAAQVFMLPSIEKVFAVLE